MAELARQNGSRAAKPDESTENAPAPGARGLRLALGLGLMHAVVDAASVGTVLAEVGLARLSPEAVASLNLAYDCVAFGMQVPIGLECDRARAYRAALLAGLALTFFGVFTGPFWPRPAMLLVGLGNALFHIGAGAIVLGLPRWGLARGSAAGPGLLLAPGAVGLALGQALGKAAFPGRWLLGALLVTGAALCFRSVKAALPIRDEPRTASPAAAAVVLLLFAVLARATMAEMLAVPWRREPGVLLAILLGAVAGKAGGGLAADRFGWRTLPLLSLGALILLGPWALTHAFAAGPAMLLCQASSGVTLAGLHRAMPGRPGLAFGLASLAVMLGVLPGFGRLFPSLDPASCLGPIAAAALLATWVGVGRVLGDQRMRGAR